MLTVSEREGGRRRSSIVAEPARRRLSVYDAKATSRRQSFSGSSFSTNFSYGPKRSIAGMAHRLQAMSLHQPTPNSPDVRYLNTYKTVPDEDKKFRSKPVKDVIESTLRRSLENCSYSPEKCSQLTASISEEVKNNVKLLGFDRYKIVCCTQIGCQNGQALRFASRCLWDASSDGAASGCFSNDTLFACVTVFGIYTE